MLGPKTHCVVVVGAQWGDEGKGKIVDVLAERADLVVRYQGGANAGHTVHTGAGEFVLHQIPSGIIQGAVCLVGNGVVLDPETLFTELDALSERGIRTENKLYVSDRAHLTLPFHKLLDRAREAREKIGTTGRGIGPTYEDKYGRRGVRVGDLRNLGRAKELVCGRVQAANEFLGLLGSSERADPGEHVQLLERLAPRLLPLAVDSGRVVWEALQRGESVLLEGAQGALLDVDHGTYPYVTSSNTTAGGAAVGAGIGPTAIDAVLGVVKAYTTRVGNGPLPTEAEAKLAERIRTLGGEFGATTGRPRRCGWFDAVVVRYAVRVNGLTGLAVTKLDVLDSFAQIPVCVGYRLDGEPFDSMPAEVERLNRVEPAYETLPGWQRSLSHVRRLADLPGGASLSRPAPGPGPRAHPLRERRHPPGPDHRSDVKRLLRGALGLIALLGATGGATRLWLGAEVPPLGGREPVAGLRDSVVVLWDSLGVPHIAARDEEDLFTAIGYLHARDRMWEMDLLRHAALGRLSELFGARTVGADRALRTLELGRIAAAQLEIAGPEGHRLLEAYAHGVNAWIAQGRYRAVEFRIIRHAAEPWRPEHSLAIGRLEAWDLRTTGDELELGDVAARLGPARAAQLAPTYPDTAPTIVPPGEWRSGRGVGSQHAAPLRSAPS